jgi:hypothetical protein
MTKVYSILGRTTAARHGRHRRTQFSAGCAAALALCCGTDRLRAQTNNAPAQENTAPTALPLAGPQITSVSAYAAYYSNALGATGGLTQANAGNLPYDIGAGGSITFNWSKFTERTIFSLSYTPSYTAQLRYSSLDALNHAFSLNVTRKLAPRWSLGFSVAANYSSQEEALFAPTTLSDIASVPANFGQLSSGLLSGNFSNNPQLGVALTNSPLLQSPLANLLYGQRVFTASAQSTLSYSLSPRLSLTFTGGSSRSQYISSNNATTATAPLLSNTTAGSGGATLSYSLSPVTQLGATVTTARVSSLIEDAYTTTSTATFGRTLAKHWIIQLHGGVGVFSPLRQTSLATATGPLPTAGGSLAFKTSSQTLLGSFDRVASDAYGLGASSTSTAIFSWQWHQPGRLWALQSSLSWQRLQGGAAENTAGWRVTVGLNRALSPHLGILWQYTYLNYSGGLQTAVNSLSESAVRVSMVWTPRAVMLR